MVESEKENSFIYSYTAKQALEDGVLSEISPELSREAGYRWPVRITQGVADLVTPAVEKQEQGQTLEGRLWDVLWLARIAIANAGPHDRIAPFDVILGRRTTRLWACFDATSGLAIHIIKPEEY